MKPSTKAKSFTISIEKRNGATTTSISPGEGLLPEDMLEGLLGGLAAVYISAWGADEEGSSDDHLTPEEFCQLIANKVMARLANYSVKEAIVQ